MCLRPFCVINLHTENQTSILIEISNGQRKRSSVTGTPCEQVFKIRFGSGEPEPVSNSHSTSASHLMYCLSLGGFHDKYQFNFNSTELITEKFFL